MKSRKRSEWRTIYTAALAAELPDGTTIMWESVDGLSYGWAERQSGRWWVGEHAFDHDTIMRDAVAHVVWEPGHPETEIEVP